MKINRFFSWGMGGLLMSLGFPLSSLCAKELAKVNQSVITDRDLMMTLGSVNEGQRASILRDVNSRREILKEIIDREILVQEGEKLKLDQDNDFKDQVVVYRKQLLMGRLLEKKFSSQLTQSAVKKYYESNKNRFSTDQVHVQQILVSDESQANKILGMTGDPKNNFQELAEKYSKDPSAKNNRGDLGYIGRDRFVPEFTDAVFSTPSGEIAGPIKTIYGYHIVKVIEKRIGKPLEFSEVELQARTALRQELVRNYVDNLRGQATIKIDNRALEKL